MTVTVSKYHLKLTFITVDSNKQDLTDTPVSSYFVHTCSLHTRGAGTLVDICYKFKMCLLLSVMFKKIRKSHYESQLFSGFSMYQYISFLVNGRIVKSYFSYYQKIGKDLQDGQQRFTKMYKRVAIMKLQNHRFTIALPQRNID